MTGNTSRAYNPPLTVEDFQRLPEEDEYRVELVRGIVVREPRPAAYHGVLTARLFRALDAHVRAHDFGEVLIETGFRLPGHAAVVRGPDVAFIAAARMPREIPRRGFWELAPDLAVEVVSPRDRWTAVQEKAFDYLGAGTAEVWIVDSEPRRVTIYRSRTESLVVAEPDALSGREVLSGFTLALTELFA